MTLGASMLMLLVAATPVAIENARVEVGDGTVLERGTVVLSGGRVTAVGRGVPVPAGARRIDGAGKVVTPGLIESSSQLGLSEVPMERQTVDHRLRGTPAAPAFRAAEGFNPRSVWIPVAREEGVTSVVVQPTGELLFGTGSWAALSGSLADLPDSARPVAMFGGVGRDAAAASGSARAGVFLKLREYFADARLLARHRDAVEQNRSRALSLPLIHLEALRPVLEGKLLLVLEAHRASDILAALEMARTEKLQIAISGGSEAWLVADRLAAAKVPVILTPSAQMPQSFEQLAARDDAATLLARAGVKLVIAAAENARRLRQEAGIAVAYGLPRAKALQAITSAPAQVFGRGDLGLLAPGKRADVVVWSGDPLELSTQAEHVFIAGDEPAPGTRQRQLVERYRKP